MEAYENVYLIIIMMPNSSISSIFIEPFYRSLYIDIVELTFYKTTNIFYSGIKKCKYFLKKSIEIMFVQYYMKLNYYEGL